MPKRQAPICDLAKRLGDHLFQLRAGRKFKDFSKEAGLPKSSLARAELGTQNLTLKKIQILCDHLECDIADLFPESKDATSARSKKDEE